MSHALCSPTYTVLLRNANFSDTQGILCFHWPGLQGTDRHFAREQDGEPSGETLEQLCGAVLAFAHQLVKLGPAPVAAPHENGAVSSHGEPHDSARPSMT